jgi:hypothetical protein
MKKLQVIFTFICFAIITQNAVLAQGCSFDYIQQIEPSTSAATFGVALGDFDNDGDTDCAAISAYYGIDVYTNDGAGTFTLKAQYSIDNSYYGVHIADVDGDLDNDIIAIPFYTSANTTILKNNGSGVFTETGFSSNISAYNAAIGNIDTDNDIDIFIPNSGGGSGIVLKNNGSGTFSLFQTVTGARGHDADLGDLDGDGDLDAFVTENSTYGNTVFLNDGTGTFSQIGTNFSLQGGTVALGDLDGDEDLDAWVGGSGNTSEIWLNDGNALFILGATIENGNYCKAVNLYDIDNDNDLDVFLGYYSSNPQVLLNMGGLTFSVCYNAPLGSSCHGQAVGYINADNLIDIYSGDFSNEDGDFVFLNTTSGTTVTDYMAKNDVILSPNPASGFVTISLPSDLSGKEYYLINSYGEMVLSGQMNSLNFKLDITGLPKGIYMLKVGQQPDQSYRFIKN